MNQNNGSIQGYVKLGTRIIDKKKEFYIRNHVLGDKNDPEDGVLKRCTLDLRKGLMIGNIIGKDNGDLFLVMKRYSHYIVLNEDGRIGESEDPIVYGIKAVRLKGIIDIEHVSKGSLERFGIDLYGGFISV